MFLGYFCSASVAVGLSSDGRTRDIFHVHIAQFYPQDGGGNTSDDGATSLFYESLSV